jgi:hypothetical protein
VRFALLAILVAGAGCSSSDDCQKAAAKLRPPTNRLARSAEVRAELHGRLARSAEVRAELWERIQRSFEVRVELWE